MSDHSGEKTAWLPDLLYTGERFEQGLALVCDKDGRIMRLTREVDEPERVTHLKNRALLPGLVNAHSHAFQRVIRGRTERRTGERDSFWTWREMMYSAAKRLRPEEVYDASRMAFLEMALGGITAVGEFHYLHHGPDGAPYADPNLLAKEVIRAALDVGLRIALLRVAYARSGYLAEPHPGQARFIEADPQTYLDNLARLDQELRSGDESRAWAGIALHSVRALPLAYLQEVARFSEANDHCFPIHMHLAEQPAEVSACLEEHGRTPVRLLEDARELELHMRLARMERAVLAPSTDDSPAALAARLFTPATAGGAESTGAPGGRLEAGRPADFFTVDLSDPSLAGASKDDLLASIVFSLSRTAIRDVYVGGKPIVTEGRHKSQHEIVERFAALQKRLWS